MKAAPKPRKPKVVTVKRWMVFSREYGGLDFAAYRTRADAEDDGFVPDDGFVIPVTITYTEPKGKR